MRWPWMRTDVPRPDVDRMLDESIAKLEAAVAELKQTADAVRRGNR